MSAGQFKTLIGQYTGHFSTKVRNTDTYRIQICILYPHICHLYPNWLATLARNLASLANGQLTWTYTHSISTTKKLLCVGTIETSCKTISSNHTKTSYFISSNHKYLLRCMNAGVVYLPLIETILQ